MLAGLMTSLWDFWHLALLLLVIFLLVAAVFAVLRVRRSRPAGAPGPAGNPLSEADAAFLDSSHIGLEPFFGAKSEPQPEARPARGSRRKAP